MYCQARQAALAGKREDFRERLLGMTAVLEEFQTIVRADPHYRDVVLVAELKNDILAGKYQRALAAGERIPMQEILDESHLELDLGFVSVWFWRG